MQRLKNTWLALMGGALLITLSVSAALGAPPAGERDTNRGQTIAAAVHAVIFGSDDEAAQDPVADDTEDEESEDTPEQDESDELDELPDADEDNEQPETDADEDADADVADSAHGECVSEVAQDPDAVGGARENHGGAVSEAARETCWETEADEATAPEENEQEDEEGEEASTHGECVAAVARDGAAASESGEKNHGTVVSLAARETCRTDGSEEAPLEETEGEDEDTEGDADELAAKAQREADRAAAKAARDAEHAARAAEREAAKAARDANANAASDRGGNAGGNGNGGGNGKGGGRP